MLDDSGSVGFRDRFYRCERKRAYSSQEDLKVCRTMNAGRQGGARVEMYWCPYCGLYHVGHSLPPMG
jgi:hypothetical protein